jgi:uncharacterized protein YpmS
MSEQTQTSKKNGVKYWPWTLILSLSLTFLLVLATVRVSTQRTTLGYEFSRVQQRLSRLSAYASKLNVERDLLLSPHYLERKGREMDMRDAQPGQIRRLP